MFFKFCWLFSSIQEARLFVLKQSGVYYYSAFKILAYVFISALIFAGGAFCSGWYVGFETGFEAGRAEVNQWWVDQKSLYYENDEILKERFLKGHDHA